MIKVDKKMVQSAVAVICVIGVILLLLATVDDSQVPTRPQRTKGRYRFSTVQKASSPPAICNGFLDLNSEGRPTRLSFTLGTEGRRRGKYDYAIGIACYVEPGSGASIYKALRPMKGTDASHFTSLRVSRDGRMFMIKMNSPPPPWNLKHDHLSINIKNAQGYKDWKELPPIKKCQRQPAYVSRAGDTVASLEQRFGVGWRQLRRNNPGLTDPNVLRSGTRVRVPPPVPVPTTYVVKKGDTLGEIDNEFRTSLHKVLRDNPQIKDPDSIIPGEVIRL